MASIYSWNVPISVPPVLDTTPCMDYMLSYEDCLADATPRHMEVFHPNWPTLWPRLLTDGHLRPDLMEDPTLLKGPKAENAYIWDKPLSDDVKAKLWECEEERFIYKACLRKVIGLKNDPRTRYPFWQPEENYTRSLGKRITTQPNNRYPAYNEHTAGPDPINSTREDWLKFVEEEGDI
mmetsp:Transcript_13060/g.24409  ORF Transcript_13060/g.24409 Transcript_13060/m.24409 type:complete len:179 (+) Transcript_13060:518-1054(+)